MDNGTQKVQTFDLSSLTDKAEYERILNTHEVIKTEFGFMRDGTPKVVVWYFVEDK
jgi:hypothetical protein